MGHYHTCPLQHYTLMSLTFRRLSLIASRASLVALTPPIRSDHCPEHGLKTLGRPFTSHPVADGLCGDLCGDRLERPPGRAWLLALR